MADLSLSDALTDSVPQSGPENVVERDFVAQLEAEPFDDKVGETVGKTDYIPLLDDEDAKQKGKMANQRNERGDRETDIQTDRSVYGRGGKCCSTKTTHSQ